MSARSTCEPPRRSGSGPSPVTARAAYRVRRLVDMPGTPPTRFVYLGPEGTFAEQALRTVPAAERGTRTPARSVGEALDSVRVGEADAALVPLENSIGGAVGVTLDEMAEGEPLVITREVVLPVEFVLGA